MAIEKPTIGPVGMTAMDLIILVDPEDMELPGGDPQTTPARRVGHMQIRGGLLYPVALEDFLQRP